MHAKAALEPEENPLSKFKLWRDGILLAVLIVGGFFWVLSSFGFRAVWALESWNGQAVAPHALRIQFRHARRGSFTLLADTAMPRKRDQVRGETPCGQFSAYYERDFGKLEIDPPTTNPCPADAALLNALTHANRYKLGDGKMTLTTSDGQTLIFQRDGEF